MYNRLFRSFYLMTHLPFSKSRNVFKLQKPQHHDSHHSYWCYYIIVSKYWGGHVSDKHPTSSCEFLNKLLHGDLVPVDCSFRIDISEELTLHGVTLSHTTIYQRETATILEGEVEESRNLSRIRIHIECAIGRLKILQDFRFYLINRFSQKTV